MGLKLTRLRLTQLHCQITDLAERKKSNKVKSDNIVKQILWGFFGHIYINTYIHVHLKKPEILKEKTNTERKRFCCLDFPSSSEMYMCH